MNILTIKNKSEERVLRAKAAPFNFSVYTKAEVRELIRAMRVTMTNAAGIGLAANQVGIKTALFVAFVNNKFYAIFNPTLTEMSRETETIDEGCLSVLETYGATPRAKKITLTGFDRNARPIKIRAWGLLARVFQHEVDHLNGALFIDKATEIHKIISNS